MDEPGCSEVSSNCNYAVDMPKILQTIDPGLRAYEEGKHVLDAKHIMLCGIQKRDAQCIKFFALCLQSSHLDKTPHELSITVSHVEIKECTCSCVAGLSGTCKHIVAVLMHLSRTPVERIEDISCTDIKQQWGKLKGKVKDDYQVVPVKKFCHSAMKDIDETIQVTETEKSYLDILLKGAPNCAIAESKRRFAEKSQELGQIITTEAANSTEDKTDDEERRVIREILSLEIRPKIDEDVILFYKEEDFVESAFTLANLSAEERKYFFENINVSLEKCIEVCAKSKYQSNDVWKKERSLRITASNAYNLVTYVNNKKPNWSTKMTSFVNNKFAGNDNTTYGKVNEPKAKELYSKVTGKHVTELGLLVNPTIPWLGYSPDGIVVDDRIVEIKCPVFGQKMDAKQMLPHLKFLDKRDNHYFLKIKHGYYCQVQLGMFITGLRECDFVLYSSYNESDCFIINVTFNEEEVFGNYLPRLQYVFFAHLLPTLVIKLQHSEE